MAKKKEQETEMDELEQELEELENIDSEEEIENLKEENKKLEKKLEDMKMTLANTQHQYMELKVDFDSFQKRISEDAENRKEQVKIDFFKKALPVFDDIFQGLANAPENIVEEKWYEGFSLVSKNIQNFLSIYNIEIIETDGQELDENLHEAISVMPGQEGEQGKILQEVTKGYCIDVNGEKKVIIPAKVVVSG